MSTQSQFPPMPFGKHKGTPVNLLPPGYLQWLSRECKLSPDLREAVRCALQRKPLPTQLSEQERIEAIIGKGTT
jgi:hypothetical protein